MKKTTISVVAFIILILVLGSSCFASQPAIIGGIRGGAALGMMLESGISNSSTLRLGFEANTSNTPGVFFIGGKWFLSDISNRFPMFLSGGLVGYLGNNSEVGPYISVIFERFLDVRPLFLEFGIDVVRSGKLQFQAGYYF
ncbi:MAG: hypothetical protein WC624_05560 [Candidatus Margulisiibacteriota bacterium]